MKRFKRIKNRFLDWWYHCHRTIFPFHRQIRAAVPSTWRDLDCIMADVLFQCIISYVEDEDGFENWGWDDSVPQKERLMEIYEYAKKRKYEDGDSNYEEETKMLMDLVKYRAFLWT